MAASRSGRGLEQAVMGSVATLGYLLSGALEEPSRVEEAGEQQRHDASARDHCWLSRPRG